mmetsp:Transcript_9654/g.18835  ORF Transcript_9654/g.18835 Transcript_9654/m.18835 type:complete len:254 (+) Transcript_9654:1398-2159(+)
MSRDSWIKLHAEEESEVSLDCKLGMEEYKILEKLSEGSSAVVYKALHLSTGNIVALKKIRIRKLDEGLPKTVTREISVCRELDHRCIVQLLDVFPHSAAVVLVLEYLPIDLQVLMQHMLHPFTEAQIKTAFKQILQGLEYLHSKSMIHRDIKPANLLIGRDCVKIADFGLCCTVSPDRPISHEVATRWYRAPELLLGGRVYDFSVDMWAAGCILAEMFNFEPLFHGDSDIDQLMRIVNVLGAPTVEVWPVTST